MLCIVALLDLGFDEAAANRAADAAGADPERAAGMLFDGEECCSLVPIVVDRCVRRGQRL